MITFVSVIEFLGTLAFAISGIRWAAYKKFDWFGGYVVGLATAIGGGTIRDVMLGVPPFWMTNSIYIICTGAALAIAIRFKKVLFHFSNTWFLFDTLGLGLFTVAGIEKTLNAGYPLWVAIIMGTITGAAGGVMRDVFINEVPLIFRKEIYALACVFGGMAYYFCSRLGFDNVTSGIMCGAVVLVSRLLAVKFHLSLPVLKAEDADEPKKD